MEGELPGQDQQCYTISKAIIKRYAQLKHNNIHIQNYKAFFLSDLFCFVFNSLENLSQTWVNISKMQIKKNVLQYFNFKCVP